MKNYIQKNIEYELEKNTSINLAPHERVTLSPNSFNILTSSK